MQRSILRKHSVNIMVVYKLLIVCVCVCVCVFVCTAAIPSCPEQTLGLVHYPTTLAPTGTSKTVYVSCADNAHVRSGYSLRILCTTDGTWEYTRGPECDCDRGYRINTANERHKCEGERPHDCSQEIYIRFLYSSSTLSC